jgi:hypothetical protein
MMGPSSPLRGKRQAQKGSGTDAIFAGVLERVRHRIEEQQTSYPAATW